VWTWHIRDRTDGKAYIVALASKEWPKKGEKKPLETARTTQKGSYQSRRRGVQPEEQPIQK